MGVRTNRVVYYKFNSQNAGDLKLIRTNGEFVQTGVRISGVLLYVQSNFETLGLFKKSCFLSLTLFTTLK